MLRKQDSDVPRGGNRGAMSGERSPGGEGGARGARGEEVRAPQPATRRPSAADRGMPKQRRPPPHPLPPSPRRDGRASSHPEGESARAPSAPPPRRRDLAGARPPCGRRLLSAGCAPSYPLRGFRPRLPRLGGDLLRPAPVRRSVLRASADCPPRPPSRASWHRARTPSCERGPHTRNTSWAQRPPGRLPAQANADVATGGSEGSCVL